MLTNTVASLGVYVHMEYTIHLDPQVNFALVAAGFYFIVRAVYAIVFPWLISSAVVSLAKSSS